MKWYYLALFSNVVHIFINCLLFNMAKLFQVMEEVKTEEKLQQRRLADCHLREQIIYKVRRQLRHLADCHLREQIIYKVNSSRDT